MTPYKASLDNVRFLINEVFAFPDVYAANGDVDADPDTVNAILEEAARFSEEVIAPLNQVGDQEGCKFFNGEVTTPPGFKEAYQQYVDGGWSGLSAPKEYGGQGLPESLSIMITEMLGTANTAWVMYPGLSHGAMAAIEAHGSEEQKANYLSKLVEGRWTGTMCLTEPHCGTDLGLIKTRAVANVDGSYAITGTKIFISAGEHDMSDNIVHLVLAKLPGAPEGTKGISLFIVPKFLPGEGDSVGARNTVYCGAIEKKMGIKGSSTCVMNFEEARGFLIGQENKGLNCMFTFMNNARITTALQGVCSGERSFQAAYAYASERLQMRALSGTKEPELPADPIIVHPDVRRMLLTMKSITEGNRALAYFACQQLDISKRSPDPQERQKAERLLSFITPVCKAFMTETGFEVTNTSMQVFGGHGYIQETGVEQLVRDCRIATIYEGTTGVQALDLLGRKVLSDRGETLRGVTKIIHKKCQELMGHPVLSTHAKQLHVLNNQWGELTQGVGVRAMSNMEEVGAASVDYLMYSGYLMLGYLWLSMAAVAAIRLESKENINRGFYTSKIGTCDFYFKRILPRASAHQQSVVAGGEVVMALSAQQIAL